MTEQSENQEWKDILRGLPTATVEITREFAQQIVDEHSEVERLRGEVEDDIPAFHRLRDAVTRWANAMPDGSSECECCGECPTCKLIDMQDDFPVLLSLKDGD